MPGSAIRRASIPSVVHPQYIFGEDRLLNAETYERSGTWLRHTNLAAPIELQSDTESSVIYNSASRFDLVPCQLDVRLIIRRHEQSTRTTISQRRNVDTSEPL